MPLRQAQILQLQRTHGNDFVQRYLAQRANQSHATQRIATAAYEHSASKGASKRANGRATRVAKKPDHNRGDSADGPEAGLELAGRSMAATSPIPPDPDGRNRGNTANNQTARRLIRERRAGLHGHTTTFEDSVQSAAAPFSKPSAAKITGVQAISDQSQAPRAAVQNRQSTAGNAPVQRQLPGHRDVRHMTSVEKWFIVLAAAGEGWVQGLTVAIGGVLAFAFIMSILGPAYPALVSAVEAVLATTAGQAFAAFLTAIGLVPAIEQIVNAFRAAARAVEHATTEEELRTAGVALGQEVGLATLDLLPILINQGNRLVRRLTERLFRMRPRLPRRPMAAGGTGRPRSGSQPRAPRAAGGQPEAPATPRGGQPEAPAAPRGGQSEPPSARGDGPEQPRRLLPAETQHFRQQINRLMEEHPVLARTNAERALSPPEHIRGAEVHALGAGAEGADIRFEHGHVRYYREVKTFTGEELGRFNQEMRHAVRQLQGRRGDILAQVPAGTDPLRELARFMGDMTARPTRARGIFRNYAVTFVDAEGTLLSRVMPGGEIWTSFPLQL